MTVLQEYIEVPRPVAEAFDYVSDFTTTREWDATAIAARKLSSGPVAVGTRFEVQCALPVGSVTLLYEVITFRRNALIQLRGSSRFFDVLDTIRFQPVEGGTRIDYRAEFSFMPWVQPLAEIGKKGLEKMGRDSVQGLAEALRDDFPVSGYPGKYAGIDRWVLPGLSLFTRLGYTLARKHFNPMSASVRGKHILITGTSAGLGLVTAGELARRGARLTLVMRDRGRARKTVEMLRAESGNRGIRYELADLSLLSEVDALVDRLLQKNQAIDVLVNNAGALFNPRTETAEGLEKSHALLLLSPVRLTEGLQPLLLQAQSPRVINVVSGGLYSQKLDVDKLAGQAAEKYSGSVAYARQKRALMVVTEEWASRWAAQGIVVNAMHPGWADTPGVRQALPLFRRMTRGALRSAEEGADTIVWLAVATEAGKVSGKLFLDRQVHTTHLLRSTRETGEERARLLDFLSTQTSPAGT